MSELPHPKELLTPELFRAWLEKTPASAGVSVDCHECPIARYLAHLPGVFSATVMAKNIRVTYLGRNLMFRAPEWVTQFIGKCDNFDHRPRGANITKEAALVYLAEIADA